MLFASAVHPVPVYLFSSVFVPLQPLFYPLHFEDEKYVVLSFVFYLYSYLAVFRFLADDYL